MARQMGSDSTIVSTDVATVGAGTVTLNGANQALVSANPSRIAIIITPIGPGSLSVALGGSAAVADRGIKLAPNVPFTLRGYTGAIRVIGTAAETVAYVEY